MQRFSKLMRIAIWNESRKRKSTILARMPPKTEPAASSKYAVPAAARAVMRRSRSTIRAAVTNSAPETVQNTPRHTSVVSSMGTGPSNWPGTVVKTDFAARNAQIVAGKLTANKHSSVAVACRGLPEPTPRALHRLLPAAVHKSHVANMIPREISLPLKTTINSRIRTICPTTALNPVSASGAFCAVVVTIRELNAGRCRNARELQPSGSSSAFFMTLKRRRARACLNVLLIERLGGQKK